MNRQLAISPLINLNTLILENSGVHDETIDHTFRCTKLIVEFGSYLNMDSLALERLEQGALIHDVGKFLIPTDILYSNRRLSMQEFEKIKEHSTLGTVTPIDEVVLAMKEQHHENIDGTGYPLGLKGEEIHPFAQILSIVDVYDALSHTRSYKEAWTLKEVEEEMNKQIGQKFNGELIDLFFKFIKSKKK